jgi:hypothetical protein
MANNINTMQIWCYINYHWNNTKIKSIQSNLFQCLFYTNKALNLGHLVKVLWKHLNSTNTRGSPLCDVSTFPLLHVVSVGIVYNENTIWDTCCNFYTLNILKNTHDSFEIGTIIFFAICVYVKQKRINITWTIYVAFTKYMSLKNPPHPHWCLP